MKVDQDGLLLSNPENPSYNNTFLVYPNPANTYLFIQSPPHGNKYKIINLLGEIISERSLGTNPTYIDISGYRAGFYIIEVYNRFDQLITARKWLKVE